MGQLLAMFRRSRLDATRIRSVWCDHIKSGDHYFQKVVLGVCSRNACIRSAMLASTQQFAANEDEENFVLSNLADRITVFFEQLITDDVISNQADLQKQCYELGRQHCSYSKKMFKISYWEEFLLMMMDVLENEHPETTKDEQKAWHAFIRFINENMLDGYLDATSYVKQ
ncbi:unnamed protein product [Caenorhabditis bovis]|uniref:Globin domain-containing protein n=1 Tax=Caenorhabditis bovis TaxID=2654633 RepID=A0A8S1EUB6_9PELO|nr:unnamed protein product [Caenorhabditis bovis]